MLNPVDALLLSPTVQAQCRATAAAIKAPAPLLACVCGHARAEHERINHDPELRGVCMVCDDCGLYEFDTGLGSCRNCERDTAHEKLARNHGICDECKDLAREPTNRERFYGLGTD